MKSGFTRRELFTFWQKPRLPLFLRPPGAGNETDFLSKCTHCHECISACPADAIVPLDSRYGASNLSPAIFPSRRACVLCDDLACTHACPTGALRPLDRRAQVRIGTAHLAPEKCLRHQGEPCAACINSCPIPGALQADATNPLFVVANECTGCGLCEQVCPTRPKAIVVLPI